MKVITCASYYGSGSSALTDLVGEYENVKDLSDLEVRFIHQLDGIADLEYHLVENHNRQNSGQALKRFKSLTRFYEGNPISKQYSSIIDKKTFRELTDTYIDQLTEFKYVGWNFYDIYDKGRIAYYFLQSINHFAKKIKIPGLRILKKEETYCSHLLPNEFLSATRDYVHGVLCALNSEEKEYIEVDQLVSSSNIDRLLRYFKDDIYVFVVDRDPRDVFLLNKFCWNDHVAPKDVESFCRWFEYTHEAGNGKAKDNEHVFYIRFEDLIYKYDTTVSLIENKTGLKPEQHIRQFSRLNPLRSAANTKLWEKYEDVNSIRFIEEKLSKYLYDYSSVDGFLIPGNKPIDLSNF